MVDYAAEDLLIKYESVINPGLTRSDPDTVHYEVQKGIEAFGASDDDFPKNFSFSFGVGSVDIEISETEDEGYSVSVNSKVFGINIGQGEIKLENGTLTKSERFGAGPVSVEYEASISFSGGFLLKFQGSGYFNYGFGKKRFSFGPVEFP